MTDGWNSTEFAEKMNFLLKRYYAGDNGLSPAAVELRAVWRTAGLAYAIFTVSNLRGIAYVGLEMTVLPGPGSAISEEETAIEGWLDRLAGDTQQKFGVFLLVAAALLLILNLTVAETTVLGISSPLLLGITGIIMMRGEKNSSGAKDY